MTLFRFPMRSLTVIVCAFCTTIAGVRAQQSTIFSFLRSTISARAAALGGATVAMTNDPSMVVMNPGSLVTTDSNQVDVTFIKHVLDINSGYLVYSMRTAPNEAYAVHASFVSYGSFNRTSTTGELLGSFGAADIALAGSYSREIDTLISWGATVKLLYGSVETQNTFALAMDGGLLFQIPKSNTNIGLSILNAGFQLTTFDGTTDKLPLDVRLGVNHQLKGLPVLVNASINHLADDVPSFFDRFLNFSVGGELRAGKYVRLRLGYDNTTRNISNVNVATQLAGVSAGAGVTLNDMHVDYAMSSVGSSALIHRISLGLSL